MIDDNINHEYIIRYLQGLYHETDPLLKNMQEYAKAHSVPIILPDSAAFLKTLCAMKMPNRILEIGTAIGYSAMLMHSVTNAEILTVERDRTVYEQAVGNIKAASLESKIRCVLNEAESVLPIIGGTFDFIFVDGAKAHYGEFFKSAKTLLNPGGFILFDNCLYKGMVATDELMLHRKRTIVKRMRRFIEEVMASPDFVSSLVPIGDGMLLAQKKTNNQKD